MCELSPGCVAMPDFVGFLLLERRHVCSVTSAIQKLHTTQKCGVELEAQALTQRG